MVDQLVMFALRRFERWCREHPDNALSRFMLKKRGPRSDVAAMSRIERLRSALGFLIYALLLLGILVAFAYAMFDLHLLDESQPIVLVLFFILALLTFTFFGAAVYLLIRVIV